MPSQERNGAQSRDGAQQRGDHPEGPASPSLLPRLGMSRLVPAPVFAPQDEEANRAEEEDEKVWEDGDSDRQRLGKAQIQVGDVALWNLRREANGTKGLIPFSYSGSNVP